MVYIPEHFRLQNAQDILSMRENLSRLETPNSDYLQLPLGHNDFNNNLNRKGTLVLPTTRVHYSQLHYRALPLVGLSLIR